VSSVGDKLIYQAVRGSHRELRELSLIDRREQVLVKGTDDIEPAVWSRDGSRLGYIHRRASPADSASAADNVEFVVLRASGTEEARYPLAPQGDTILRATDWASDGGAILGGCRPGGSQTMAVCLLDVRRGDPKTTVIASHPELNLFQPRFSSDSRWVTFMAVNPLEGGTSTIYVVPAGGGPWAAITDGRSFDDKPRWSPDGRRLYFISNSGAFFNVWGRRFDPVAGQPVGSAFRVTSFNSPRLMISPDRISSAGIAVAADRLVLPITEATGQLWVLESVNR
jgi:Tol biopolymer transport system component